MIAVGEKQKVATDSPFRVERLEVATGLKQPRWLRALQMNPTDRRVVHYAAVYEARNGRWLGTWTPSTQVSEMPGGSGVPLPAGARLTVEIGYRGNMMEDASGAGELGLYFLDKPAAQTPTAIEIAATAVNVAPARKGERMRAETTIKRASTIASLWPRLGPGARSLEVTAIRPDGSVEPMLWVNNYRAEWPAPYILKEPLTLPAGTRLLLTAYYDNPTGAAVAAKPSLSITALQPRLRDTSAQ